MLELSIYGAIPPLNENESRTKLRFKLEIKNLTMLELSIYGAIPPLNESKLGTMTIITA